MRHLRVAVGSLNLRRELDMFFFLVPRRYRAVALLAFGVVWMVLGVVMRSRNFLVIGGVMIVGGAIIGLRRMCQKAAESDRLAYAAGGPGPLSAYVSRDRSLDDTIPVTVLRPRPETSAS